MLEQAIDQELEQMPAITDKQMQYKQQIDQLALEEEEIIEARGKPQPKIKLSQMPQQVRHNKLKTESKILMNVIKMICYRAESAIANMLAPHLANADNEKRMVVKQIISSNADLTPDYQEKTLTVKLYSLSANRYNHAVKQILQTLNDSETVFPGTDLRMIFTSSAV
ncbi:MAG: hypothetical protein HC905_08230 [Bacteroidales bacterium]|nr:hypothetical protein [Bacteroidales bacterium]